MLHIKQPPMRDASKNVVYAKNETENRKQKTQNRKKRKTNKKRTDTRTHTQHVAGLRTERFIWHLKMIIGYKLIATMLTLSANYRQRR